MASSAYINIESRGTVFTRLLVYLGDHRTNPWAIPQLTFSTVECWPFITENWLRSVWKSLSCNSGSIILTGIRIISQLFKLMVYKDSQKFNSGRLQQRRRRLQWEKRQIAIGWKSKTTMNFASLRRFLVHDHDMKLPYAMFVWRMWPDNESVLWFSFSVQT